MGFLDQIPKTPVPEAATMPTPDIITPGQAAANMKLDTKALGPGFVKGYLASQDNRRSDQGEVRAEKATAMAQDQSNAMLEEHGWKREAKQKEDLIQAGMSDAAQSGGYEAVVDFLKTADPERAMLFDTKKQELDRSIMGTQVMQAVGQKDMVNARVEAYGALGKMGTALLNAKEGDRAAMYQTMLPMVKAVNPDAPNSLDSNAVGMFMLAQAQATPANLLYYSHKNLTGTLSTLGKIDSDIRARQAAGVSPDDPSLKTLLDQRETYSLKKDQAVLQLNSAEIKTQSQQQSITAQQFQATETTNKNLLGASKDFAGNFLPIYTSSVASRNVLKSDPTNAAAQQSLARAFVKLYNTGAMSDKDAAIAFSATGAPEMMKKFKSIVSGQVVALNPRETANLSAMFDALGDNKLASQQAIENQFHTSTEQFGGLVDWNKIRRPSQQYLELRSKISDQQKGVDVNLQKQIESTPPEALKALQQNPDKLPDFIAAFGYDPSKVPQQPKQGQ